jgi:hypothetical protein
MQELAPVRSEYTIYGVCGGLLEIFTVLKRGFPLYGSIGFSKVFHHVSSLNKAWLQCEWHPQHWFVLMPIRPANAVVWHLHLNRKPRMAARPTDPFADHFIR